MKFLINRVIFAGLALALVSACSSGELAELEKTWPDLSDIQPAANSQASAIEPESVIRALREEAERRKSEGYQAPEVTPQVAPDVATETTPAAIPADPLADPGADPQAESGD